MALGYRILNSLPRLHNYGAAVAHEARVKPIRGDKTNLKPLGIRTHKHISIRKDEAETGPNSADILIIYGWGNQIMMRYKPDDTIILYPPAYSQKAVYGEIVGELTNWYWKSFDGKFWLKCANNVWHSLVPNAENAFRYVQHGPPVFVNPTENVTHQINRKGKARVFRDYATFRKYVSGMYKLRDKDTGVTIAETIEVFGSLNPGEIHQRPAMPPAVGNWNFHHDEAAEFCALMLNTDPDAQYRAFLQLLGLCYRLPQTAEITRRLDRTILMHHHEECLKKLVHTDGKARRDAYKWAVPLVPGHLT